MNKNLDLFVKKYKYFTLLEIATNCQRFYYLVSK